MVSRRSEVDEFSVGHLQGKQQTMTVPLTTGIVEILQHIIIKERQ